MSESTNRLRLIQRLNNLSHSKFEELVTALEVPSGILPSYFAPQGDRSAALLGWVEGPTGPGLTALQDILAQITASNTQGRQDYNDWLQKQIEEPMFAEAFSLSLKQVYVPLRAWYHQKKESNYSREDRYERVVVELETELQHWLETADANDAIRVISGGPGSGKSSFSKMFAANLAKQGTVPVVFVPLHQFDPTEDLIQSMSNFIEYDSFLVTNPLQLSPKEPRQLIIFDGLDELAIPGKIAKEVSQAFVREVNSKLERFKQRQTLLQVIISGRELAIKDNNSEFRNPRQILHLLPHFIPEEKREEENGEPYVIEGKASLDLLKDDRRQSWWKKYGTASGKGYTALPAELNQGNLVEITAQPLLNYLVALSYNPNQPEAFGPKANHNQIYQQLLEAVYKRGYERKGTHKAIRKMEKQDFVEILEEVALATWHSGESRTTTVAEIQKYCHSSNQTKSLEVFQEGAEAGVTRLLMAFDFHQRDPKNGIFEFTHKSFEEYLVACRIVRTIKQIQEKRDALRNEPERWDERTALIDWVTVCGPSALNMYILEFLRNEIQLYPQAEVERWQKTLSTLFDFILRHSMPMEEMVLLKTFRAKVIQAQHAEETLLAALNACARTTATVLTINWPNPEAIGTWVARMWGQRGSYYAIPLIFQCLGYLNLSNGIFISSNLTKADLSNTNLSEADLRNTNLSEANLSHTNLSHTNLSDANLSHATLENATLENAFLCDANLNNANLSGANLSRAILIDAKLGDANLIRAILIEATLENADLRGTDLSYVNLYSAKLYRVDLDSAVLHKANLSYATLSESNLSGAILSSANLSNSNLSNVDLSKTNLSTANLDSAGLQDASLSGAILVGATLHSATLISADFSGADLSNADLSGADLSGADLSDANLKGVKGLTSEQMRSISHWKNALIEDEMLQTIEHSLHGYQR